MRGHNFGGARARQLKLRLRLVRIAKESGYGHRCISHDRTNPYDAALPEHAAWNDGWAQADRELNGSER